MDQTLVSSTGTAQMTYDLEPAGLQTVSGKATTAVTYDGEQPVAAHMELDFGTLWLSFGVDPFNGTGEYTELQSLMFTMQAALDEGCHGFWTTSSAAPGPILDVTLTPPNGSTSWASTLMAALTWSGETCNLLPIGLTVKTLTNQQVQTADAGPAVGFSRRRAIDFARRFGVSSPPHGR